ncbi:prepilin-type N-terminal cleavage/methylation domain-containing protein [Lederbergia citri]|uniref:Prepilin-type N-terminal cleavage/methylation domain-containing protein n=1 Tax=Lederbergia citri TaxID=2833580 RepID=A0A942YHX2_9BACI|nr:prepilin-type N-terminal cleavage/methylation domain-containing protein [Lederbergia citri]MBS4194841.1 prepilin-type N-terminal cleavage/methylation domain-containing protein [Lederbergia citri]
MIKKYITHQQGITLLELLAALAISTLVIGLTFSVLFSSKKFNDKTHAYVDLRQEANIIISSLRKHQKNSEKVCHEQLLTNDNISMEIQINEVELKSGYCWTPTNSNDTHVKFTLKDKKQHNKFDVDTIIEGRERKDFSINIPDQPVKEETFFDYLKNNNVFVYGNDLDTNGSNSFNGSGTILINNFNHSNLLFNGGGSVLSVKKIFINKNGNEVIFSDSTRLGELEKTETVRIIGNVQLNRGTAAILGDTIYISGNVTFDNGAVIKGKKVIIGGNVTFKNSSDKITADEIYVTGTIKKIDNGNIVGRLFNSNPPGKIEIPVDIPILPPSFREDSWYSTNGYEVTSSVNFSDNSKIFSPSSFTVKDWHSNKQNVIIISKGDITLEKFGGSDLTGILFAPNGKVTFKGKSFNGVVIAKNGFFTNGETKVTFTNVDEFIKNPDKAPFK